MVTLPPLAILGTGSMGGAILAGLLSPDVSVDGIRVTNRTRAKAEALAAPGVTSLATEDDPDANRRAVEGARIVLLGVKPAGIVDLLSEVTDALHPDAVVVSVAAGITTTAMEAATPARVMRAMPNTPSVIKRGVTGLAAGSRSTEEDLALVTALFETVGTVLVVPEYKINALSTISGSGPAYVFFLIERFTATALKMGFTLEESRLLVEETFLGASELLAKSDALPADLRHRVTSPKGTTERAIAVLERADLTSVFDRAVRAALERAEELAAGA